VGINYLHEKETSINENILQDNAHTSPFEKVIEPTRLAWKARKRIEQNAYKHKVISAPVFLYPHEHPLLYLLFKQATHIISYFW